MAAKSLDTVRTVAALRERVRAWRAEGLSVGLVPTMGGLHEGHASLARASAAACDRTIATLFVNPRQFENPADLERYPRSEATDAALLAASGATLLFAPPPEVMYPPGFATTVSVRGPSEGLCGAARPGHFDGVSTVVTKLLLQAGADRAFFGEKDYQQLQVVKQLVRDLDIPVEIVGCPTVRDADGLALSSRNAYLDARERRIAPSLHRVLSATADALARGEEAPRLLAAAHGDLARAGFEAVDYIELREEGTLSPLRRADRPARLLAAVRLGAARLIDNVPVRPAPL